MSEIEITISEFFSYSVNRYFSAWRCILPGHLPARLVSTCRNTISVNQNVGKILLNVYVEWYAFSSNCRPRCREWSQSGLRVRQKPVLIEIHRLPRG